jgi:gluconolactonase
METLASGFGLLEGPVWDRTRGLLFADTARGGGFCLAADGSIRQVFEHRRGIGGMVLHADGGLVMSGRNLAYKGPASPGTLVLIERAPERGIVGFNDITTDPLGCIYAGALGFVPTETELSGIGGAGKPAPLFRIGLDGSVTQVHPSILLSNGMGFGPDGTRFYHADSGDRTVYISDVLADGTLQNRRPFAEVTEGLPDGLAIGSDGAVWLALAHAGKVRVIAADGRRRFDIDFPVPMVTSLCFGGPDLRDLFVLTGSDGSGRDDAGCVFRLRVETPGLPVAPAGVRLPPAAKGP